MMIISLDKFHFTAATNTGKKASTAEATKNLTALLADKKNFKKIDTNGDGILTPLELEKFKQKLADADNLESNGLSEFAGFEKAFERLQAQQGNLSVAVKKIDTNGDGILTAPELEKFKQKLADADNLESNGLSEFAGFKAFERLQAQQGNISVAVTRFGISFTRKIDNDFRYAKRSEDTGFNVLAVVYANATAKAENLTVDDSNPLDPLDTVVTAFLNGLQDAAAALASALASLAPHRRPQKMWCQLKKLIGQLKQIKLIMTNFCFNLDNKKEALFLLLQREKAEKNSVLGRIVKTVLGLIGIKL